MLQVPIITKNWYNSRMNLLLYLVMAAVLKMHEEAVEKFQYY